jgi:hypothetical protein
VNGDNKFLTAEEVSERYRGEITVGTLRNWRAMRIGPAFVKIGKAVLYPVRELDAWDQKNLVICDGSRSGCMDEREGGRRSPSIGPCRQSIVALCGQLVALLGQQRHYEFVPFLHASALLGHVVPAIVAFRTHVLERMILEAISNLL